MGLFDTTDAKTWEIAAKPCRPQMQTGCIQLIHYWRALSNGLPEYGPFNRIIDRGRLVQGETMDAIYGPDRFTWSVSNCCLGVSERERLDFEDYTYPTQGMSCGITTQAERDALTA